MTKIDKERVEDRITVFDDEKKRVIDLYELNLIPPVSEAGIFDEPTRCYKINQEWASIVMGMVSATLVTVASWRDAQDENYSAIQEIMRFLRGENCVDCEQVVDCMEVDPNYLAFSSMVFNQSQAATQQHLDDLEDLYDGTPQSIGSEIPTGDPNMAQENSLCHALQTFVSLYAAVKLARLQQRNFIQIAWDNLVETAEFFYGIATDLVGFVLGHDIASCFVSDTEAMTALVDTEAIGLVACCLYDSLKDLAMSQANFDTVLSDCTTSLSANAQKIACIMELDNSLQVYLSFLEAYNKDLLSGDTFDCACTSNFPSLVIGWCYNADAFGTLTQEGDDTWLLDFTAEPGGGVSCIFEDALGQTFRILDLQVTIGGSGAAWFYTTEPCTRHGIGFGFPALVNLPNVNGYNMGCPTIPTQVRIVVSERGA